jgi:diguanylate cyclase (GGDEF)-like protein
LLQLSWAGLGGIFVLGTINALGERFDFPYTLAAFVLLLPLPFLIHYGWLATATTAFLGVTSALALFFAWNFGGLHDLSMLALPVILVIAALVAGRALVWTLFALIVVNILAMGIANDTGLLEHSVSIWGLPAAVQVVVLLTIALFAVSVLGNDYVRALKHLEGKIQEVRASNSELAYRARHDDLTGLPNRASSREDFDDWIRSADPERSRLAVLFIDIDEFRNINDFLGHSSGDAYLRTIARRLTSLLPEGGSVYRVGGDEFMVFYPFPGHARFESAWAQAVLQKIVEPVDLDGYPLICSASMGIVVFPDDSKSFDDLVRHADIALHRAKAQGRNRHVFHDHRASRLAARRVELLTALRKALPRQHVQLAYQPICHLRSKRFVAAEALLRWEDPEHGTVSPEEFVPIAEYGGLGRSLTRCVLTEAVAAVAELSRHGFHEFSISINISPLQLLDPGFLEDVAERVPASGDVSRRLVFELTESADLEDSSRVERTLEKLRGAGFGIAIDDFGTGYSSLARVQRLDAKYLKIDRSFVSGVVHRPDNIRIVRAASDIAREFGLEAIAEGVESSAEARFVEEMGIEYGQGYWWSDALPLPALVDFLGASDARK